MKTTLEEQSAALRGRLQVVVLDDRLTDVASWRAREAALRLEWDAWRRLLEEEATG